MTTVVLLVSLLAPADVPEPDAQVTAVRSPYDVASARLGLVRLGMTLKQVDTAVGARPDIWSDRLNCVTWVDRTDPGRRAVEVGFRDGVVVRVQHIPGKDDDGRRRMTDNLLAHYRSKEWPPK